MRLKYPYKTKKRTVLYGGHASFLRVMKQRFPTIKFHTKDKFVDPKVIRLSDVVWIQNNCISHCVYNKVIKVANAYNVPVQYFANAGTQAASKQLIDYDCNNQVKNQTQ